MEFLILVYQWGPVVERLCSKWTANLSDQIVCKCIVVFFLLTASFLSFVYLSIVSYLLRYLFSSVPTLRLYLCEPSQTCSHVSCSKYSPFVTSVIRHLSLPLWCQVSWIAPPGIWLATMAKSLFIFFSIFFYFIFPKAPRPNDKMTQYWCDGHAHGQTTVNRHPCI